MIRIGLVNALAYLSAATWLTALAQPGITSPEAVSRLLEQRWTVELIREYCRPETRHDPFRQNLVPSGDDVWQGTLHPKFENELGKITWYGDVANGKLMAVSVNVSKAEAHWILEIVDVTNLTSHPLTNLKVLARRIDLPIFRALSLQLDLHPEWGRTSTPVTEEDKTFSRYYDLLHQEPSQRLIEFDVASGRPVKYTRYCDDGKIAVTVDLDSLGNPSVFQLNGVDDKFLNRMYAEFRENWSRHLEEVTR